MNFYPRFPGDYMRKTMHLSMLEDGAYTRLLDWYYANDRAIPHDRRYAVARAATSGERAAVDSVLAEFFALVDGQHRNERAETEIQAGLNRIDAARANGKKGGRKPKVKPIGNPVGFDPHTPTLKPIESSLSPQTDSVPEGTSSGAAKSPRPSRKCPDSFEPDDPDAFCAEQAKGIDWRAETAKFRDHTFKTALVDWQGAWRNWMRRSAELRTSSTVHSNGRHAGFATKNYREGVEADGSFT